MTLQEHQDEMDNHIRKLEDRYKEHQDEMDNHIYYAELQAERKRLVQMMPGVTREEREIIDYEVDRLDELLIGGLSNG